MTKQVTVSELQVAKRKAEKHIAASVQEALEKFQGDTGVSATSVCIYLADVTTFGESTRKFIVRDAQIDIEI